MIYIEKGLTNSIVLTLSESTTILDPYYIFEFINEYNLGSNSIFYSTPDVSNYTNRYNMFLLEESVLGATTSVYNEALSLTTGQYIYNIYQNATQSLSIENATLIETGRMVVSGNSDDIENITDTVYI